VVHASAEVLVFVAGGARLAVPASLSDADLKSALESLANEMMVELDPAERGN